jgi:hypothetical protein
MHRTDRRGHFVFAGPSPWYVTRKIYIEKFYNGGWTIKSGHHGGCTL